jgi:hypothetical protein
LLLTIDGEDEKDDGEGEGDGLQQVEGSDESGLLRILFLFLVVLFCFSLMHSL